MADAVEECAAEECAAEVCAVEDFDAEDSVVAVASVVADVADVIAVITDMVIYKKKTPFRFARRAFFGLYHK